MKRTKWRAVAIGVGVSMLALLTPSPSQAAIVAEAGVWSNTSADAPNRDGVDFDAGCVVSPTAPPPLANHYRTDGGLTTATGSGTGSNDFPGCPRQNGHNGVSLYDGSTESTDIATVDLTSYVGANGEVWLKATVTVDGRIPAAGTVASGQDQLDTPDDVFRGIGVKVMFQNKDKQHNGDNPLTGCARAAGPGRVRDQSGHWRDGWHYFLGFDVTHDGQTFVHSVSAGYYDPTPDGAFFFDEFGVNSGAPNPPDRFNHNGAVNDDLKHQAGADWKYQVNTAVGGPSTITVETKGLVKSSNSTCSGGEYVKDYGSEKQGRYSTPTHTGDRLHSIKGLSTANQVVVLPVTVPLSATCDLAGGVVCESDLTSAGGFIFFSDTTAGGSTNGSVAGSPPVNIVGIAYSGGAVGVSDTLGETQTCPTPTFGGTVPDNPIWAAQEAGSTNGVGPCEIDDDNPQRGSVLSEWWETAANYNIP